MGEDHSPPPHPSWTKWKASDIEMGVLGLPIHGSVHIYELPLQAQGM